MLQKHPTLKRALSLVLSLAIILTTCVSLVGTGGKAEAAASLPYIEELKNQQGGAFKRKDDMYRMAQANKAFAHYRW